MNLFEIKDFKLTFSPQALALAPFKQLWNNDKSKDKNIAINELSYVYFMCDYESDYDDIIDEEERSAEILSVLDLPKNWKPDNDVENAIDFYKKRRDGMVMKLFDASKILINKIVEFSKKVNLDERDKNGRLIYNVKQINDMIKQLGATVESVQDLEKMVKREISNNKSKVGSREKNLYEDGI